MYKVIIVDDEPKVRRGISRLISDNAAQWEIIGETGNAYDALNIAGVCRPDLVITDIRMPGMDGLAFVEKLKAISPDTAVIIYSGFPEFEYAQKAITYKVSEFLLKPLDEEEFFKALAKVEKELQEIANGSAANTNMKEQNLRYVDSLFREFILSESTHKMPKELCGFFSMEFEYYYMIYIETLIPMMADRDVLALQTKVRQIISECIEKNGFTGYVLLPKEGSFLVFLQTTAESNNLFLLGLSEKIQEALSDAAGIPSSLGISSLHSGVESFYPCYVEAFNAAKYEIYEGIGKIFAYEETFAPERFIFRHDLQKLANCLRTGNVNELMKQLAEVNELILNSRPDITALKSIIEKMLLIFENTLNELKIDCNHFANLTFKLKLPENYHCYKDIRNDMDTVFCSAAKLVGMIYEQKKAELSTALFYLLRAIFKESCH